MCLYVSLYVCYATSPRCFASRVSNFQGFIYDHTVGSSQIIFFSKFTLCTNNQITLCNYYIQLSAILCKHLLTSSCVFSSIVQSYVIQRKAALHATITASFTSQIQDAINILTGSTPCTKALMDISVIMLCILTFYKSRTTKLSRPEVGQFTCHEPPSYPVRRLGNLHVTNHQVIPSGGWAIYMSRTTKLSRPYVGQFTCHEPPSYPVRMLGILHVTNHQVIPSGGWAFLLFPIIWQYSNAVDLNEIVYFCNRVGSA